MVTAVVGANWGDEGKGKITDTLADQADVVVRCQGGANAGHTIKNQYGKFALHTVPSGAFHQNIMNIMGAGVAFDIDKFMNEIEEITSKGVPMPQIMISNRAQVMMPYHVLLDSLEEARLAGKAFGSTKSGIAPFYSDKYAKIGWQLHEFFQDDDVLMEKINRIADIKDAILVNLYHTDKIDREGLLDWIKTRREKVKPFIGDVSLYLFNAINEGKNVLLEGQLDLIGAVRPQALQLVVLAILLVEHVHHHVAVVQHAPAAFRVALAALGKDVGLGQLLLHVLRQRLHLRHAAARGDDHVIGDHGHLVHLQHDDILGALVVKRLRCQQRDVSLIHVSVSSCLLVLLSCHVSPPDAPISCASSGS